MPWVLHSYLSAYAEDYSTLKPGDYWTQCPPDRAEHGSMFIVLPYNRFCTVNDDRNTPLPEPFNPDTRATLSAEYPCYRVLLRWEP